MTSVFGRCSGRTWACVAFSSQDEVDNHNSGAGTTMWCTWLFFPVSRFPRDGQPEVLALGQRRPQKRFDRRLEEVAQPVGGCYCRLQMPLRLALGVRGTVAGHRLGALEGGWVDHPPFQCIPAQGRPPRAGFERQCCR